MIDYFAGERIPRNIALVVSYAILLIVVAGFLYVVSGPLIRDFEQVSNQIANSYERNHGIWLEYGSPFQRTIAELIPAPENQFVEMGNKGGIQLFQGLIDVTTNLVGFFGSLGLVLILSLYWSADRLHFERLLLSLIAVNQRERVRMMWRGIEKGVGAYIRSEFTQSLLAGFLLWFGYRLMGLDYPVLLAVLGALAWLIPWFGAVIATIPPLLVGISINPALGIIAALYTLLVLGVQEYIIEPKIFRRNSYSSLLLMLVILILTDAFGLIGLVLAPLLSATIQNIFKYLVQPPITFEFPDQLSVAPIETTDSLRRRLEEARDEAVACDRNSSLVMTNLMERLDHLIVDTERYIESNQPDARITVDQPVTVDK